MIVKMSRVYIATGLKDRDRLLDLLGKVNLIHLEPVNPKEAVADKKIPDALEILSVAINILSHVKPSGDIPSSKPLDAAREAVELQKSIIDDQHRLSDLHHKIKELEIWDNVGRSQLDDLRENGVEVRFFIVPQLKAHFVGGDCAEVLSILPGKRVLMAVIDRNGRFEMPEGSKPLPFPSQDRASVLSEAKNIDTRLKQTYKRLTQLAGLLEVLREEQERLTRKIVYIKAQRSGMSRGELFALQGWLPTEKADKLRLRLEADNFPAAVHVEPVKPDDMPPTLIRYSSWTRPIKGLFDMLGTCPGYREIDLSPFFVLALPVFAAMLINDAGYGLLIFLTGLFFYYKTVRGADRSKAQIMLILGAVTLVWGMLTANYFGVTPETLAIAGGYVKLSGTDVLVDYDALWKGNGFYGQAAGMMYRAGLLWREDPNVTRLLIMKVSLIIGCLHLILARFRKMAALIPDQRALAEIGWVIAIADMLVIIWFLLFIGVDRAPAVVWWVLGAAIVMSACFSNPDRSMTRRFLMGLFTSILPLLNTFTDTMSYVRLFAIGLSSYYISSAFNAMGMQVAEATNWFVAVPILIFGHGLNIALATIAIFAHGVRLNMLEFSNHAGVQWNGYAYQPFNTEKNNISGEDIIR